MATIGDRASDDVGKEGMEKEVEILASKMKKKVVVSLDHINWEHATTDLKWAILVKLASGKPI